MKTKKRLELSVNCDNTILDLWRADDDKTIIKLSCEDGELTMIVRLHTDVEDFLKQSLSFIKELGI